MIWMTDMIFKKGTSCPKVKMNKVGWKVITFNNSIKEIGQQEFCCCCFWKFSISSNSKSFSPGSQSIRYYLNH